MLPLFVVLGLQGRTQRTQTVQADEVTGLGNSLFRGAAAPAPWFMAINRNVFKGRAPHTSGHSDVGHESTSSEKRHG